jgi:hypothetical protein
MAAVATQTAAVAAPKRRQPLVYVHVAAEAPSQEGKASLSDFWRFCF